uniref:Putative LOC101852594 [Aplysia californica] n=1 Tax=Lepeophtheirus salmonis TaxID=72036 RepID=A0A0K2T2Y2_LEPSM
MIIYLWSKLSTVSTTADQTGLSKRTLVDCYNFLREICKKYFQNKTVRLSRPWRVVEIDESKFGKTKYHRGRYQAGQWFFWGVDIDSGDCFMVEIQDRTAATMLSLIAMYVEPETTFMSDDWASYRWVYSLGMQHFTVVHKTNYVDLLTGATCLLSLSGVESRA